jgi:hypothetical protein
MTWNGNVLRLYQDTQLIDQLAAPGVGSGWPGDAMGGGAIVVGGVPLTSDGADGGITGYIDDA